MKKKEIIKFMNNRNEFLNQLSVLRHEQTDEVIIYNELLNTYFRFNSVGERSILDKKSVWDHCEEVLLIELKNTLITEEIIENYFLEIRSIAELFTTNKTNEKTGQLLKDYLNNFDRK